MLLLPSLNKNIIIFFYKKIVVIVASVNRHSTGAKGLLILDLFGGILVMTKRAKDIREVKMYGRK